MPSLPLNLLLIPVGSHGDVHPLVGLGVALRARGHRVCVLTNGYFRELVERAGLAFEEHGTAEQYLETINNPEIWHPTGGTRTVMQQLVTHSIRLPYEVIERRSRETAHGPLKVIASPLCFGARVAAEKLGVPLLTTQLQPVAIRSCHDPSALAAVAIPEWSPAWWVRFLYWVGDRFVVDPLVCPPLNEFRRELGLTPVSRPLKGWWNSPRGVLALFPEWYARPQSDWPANTVCTGFPNFDERGVTAPDAELQAFLDAGAPPLVFTPGSAMRHGRAFFSAAAEACERLKRRGLLLTRFPENIPERLPEGVRHFSFAPFSSVLPRAAALVHHGGIGTLAQGFAAGVPQLIMPMSHDQPDNARRAKRLGVAGEISVRRFRGPNVARALEPLLSDAAVQRACAAVKAQMAAGDALATACAAVERLFG